MTRRSLLRTAATAALAPLAPTVFARRAHGKGGTLRICQWTHFIPAFDEWFDDKFARDWGEKNGVRVVVEHVSVNDLRARARVEVAARKGHDLFGFLDPPAAYEDHVVPLNDVVSECERRFGKLVQLVRRTTYNPSTKRYFAFCDTWVANPLHYRTDWWDDAGVKPETWDRVREGARKIKAKHGAPAGFGLAPELDSNMMLRGLLWSYGASEQDEAGNVTVNSKATVEAIKLMTAIFQESMTPEVFMWDPSSNNRFYVYGRGSIIQNGISALRTAEQQNPDVAKKTALAPAAAGPKARLTSAHVVPCYVVWKFAENPERAEKFLVDLVASYDEVFRMSRFYNFPAFPKSVSDLRGKLAADKQNPRAYLVLADAEQWSASPGHPGYTTAAMSEVFDRFVIPRMFARAARGEQSPGASARQAELEMKRIFARWAR
ncbi:MAG: extracellular solute-binding protein [Candidatus Rokubacteria bacterium]|nr:extracellular solute-binding protein [Candidatus Rokubacteria bacterium]